MITESAFDRNEVSFMNIRHKRKEKEESVSTARELFQWVAAIVAAVLIALAIDITAESSRGERCPSAPG